MQYTNDNPSTKNSPRFHVAANTADAPKKAVRLGRPADRTQNGAGPDGRENATAPWPWEEASVSGEGYGQAHGNTAGSGQTEDSAHAAGSASDAHGPWEEPGATDRLLSLDDPDAFLSLEPANKKATVGKNAGKKSILGRGEADHATTSVFRETSPAQHQDDIGGKPGDARGNDREEAGLPQPAAAGKEGGGEGRTAGARDVVSVPAQAAAGLAWDGDADLARAGEPTGEQTVAHPGSKRAGTDHKRQPWRHVLRCPVKLPASLLYALRLACTVFLGLFALVLALLLAVQLNVDRITSYALEEISRKSGVTIESSGAILRLFPRPALGLQDVNLVVPVHGREGDKNADAASTLDFRARTVYFAPKFLPLLQGSFEPDNITLDVPRLTGRLPLSFAALGQTLSGAGSGQGSGSLEDILPGVLAVHEGALALQDAEGNVLRTENLNVELTLTSLPLKNPLNGLDVAVKLDRISFQTPTFAAVAADLNIQGRTSLTEPLHDLNLAVQGRLAVTPLQFAVAMDMKLGGTSDLGLLGRGRIKGHFTFDGVEIPYDISGELGAPAQATQYMRLVPAERKGEETRHFRLTHFGIGEDVLELDSLLLPKTDNPGVAGRLVIKKLSLTRWLTFARNLSPGLQIALDRVTDGYIDFFIDSKSLVAPDILACAGGAAFTGSGGIASWKDIVVFLDMTSDSVDLGKAIPESVGNLLKPPKYGHRPLSEMRGRDIFPPEDTAQAKTPGTKTALPAAQGTFAKSGSAGRQAKATAATAPKPAKATQSASAGAGTSLSYDIRLGARKIHYGYLDLTDGSVIIHPGTNSRGVASARLDMKTSLHEGTITGYGHFTDEDRDGQSEYEFNIEGKNVNLARLHKQLNFIPIVGGTGSCRVQVTSAGGEIDKFLANLRGRVQATAVRATLVDDKIFSPLRAQVVLDIGQASFRNSSLGLSGNWNVVCDGASGWNASFTLPGQIWFGGTGKSAGVRFDRLATVLDVKKLEALAPSVRGSAVNASLKGQASLDTSKRLVSLEAGHVSFPGLSLDGNLSLVMNNDGPRIEATLSKASCEPRRLILALKGENADVPDFARHINLAGVRLEARENVLSLPRFSASLDKMSVSGSLTAKLDKSVPDLSFELHTGPMDLDAMIFDKDKARSKGTPTEAKPYDFTGLKKFNARGSLLVERLHAKKTTFDNLHCQLSLSDGHLRLRDIRGSAYGGAVSGSVQADFDRGMNFSASLKVTQLDAEAMMKDRGVKAIFRAQADFAADISSGMSRPGELARNLNGRVAFQAGQGSFQSVEDDGTIKDQPTYFSRAGCTAQIGNGVLRTNDFALLGRQLRLTGGGWVDLAKETMDMHFVADMNNLPNIPLRLYGSLDHPKREISGGMIILNALGGLARGAFNAIGSVFSGLVGMFN